MSNRHDEKVQNGLSVFAMFVLVALPCFTPSRVAESQARQAPSRTIEEGPFDLSVERLPPQYKGASVSAVFQGLFVRRSTLQKSSYETEAAYEGRISKLNQEPLEGRIPLGGLVALIPSCQHSDFRDRACHTYYDAETQTLRIESPVGYGTSFMVREDDSPARPAGIAHTAIGVAFSYKTMNMVKYMLASQTPAWYTREKQRAREAEGNETISLSLTPNEARQADGQISELVIGRLVAPFTDDIEEHVDPAKTTWPLESHMQFRTIHFEITAIWIFNSRTGEIYKKLADQAAEGH